MTPPASVHGEWFRPGFLLVRYLERLGFAPEVPEFPAEELPPNWDALKRAFKALEVPDA